MPKDEADLDTLDSTPTQPPQVPDVLDSQPGIESVAQDSPSDPQEITSALVSLRATASSMPFNPKDPATVALLQKIFNLERVQAAKLQFDAHPALDHQELINELANLRAVASTKPFHPEDPATVELLQQIFNLERKLARLNSGSYPFPVLPIVSLDIKASTVFVTIRIARFLLRSAVPSATIAIILSLVFYSKSGEMSVLTAAMFSALAVLAATLFYLVSQPPWQACAIKTCCTSDNGT